MVNLKTVYCFTVVTACLLANTVCSAQSDTAEYRQAMARAVRNAAERVLPSIVSIEVIGVAEVAGGGNRQSEVAQDAPSCGIVVDAEGYIVASDIIVRRPSASILVVLPDATRLAATLVARDYHRGLVMLRVDTKSPLAPIELAEAVNTPIGSTVVAIGRYGGDRSPMVSSGILSATGRLEGTMLQSDARVSPSFYGGPLVDLYGNVIGVLVPAVAEGGAPDDTSWYDSGIAFAVPSPVLANKLPRLRAGEDIRKGLIGIVPKAKDPYAEDTELAAVRSRSPAEKSGIQPGDSVVAIGGDPVRMFQQIKQALGPYDAGESIEITLRRNGETRTVNVTLAESIPPLSPQRLGVWLTEEPRDDAEDATDEAAKQPKVVVRAVVPDTAAEGKLNPGDAIKQINQTEITDVATAGQTMITAVADEELTLTIERDGEPLEIKLTPTSIAGPTLKKTIDQWSGEPPENPWDVQELRLPDVPNLAAYVAPKPETIAADDGLALLVLLLPPDTRDPQKALQGWRDAAGKAGVVVCAVCSEDEQRWQQKEIDVVSRMATLMAQRVPVLVSAVAANGAIKDTAASAADSMVIAMALSDRKNFAGIAVSANAKPPAVRLRENEPDRALEIMLPIESLDNGPTWLAPLATAGYPISLGGETEIDDLLRWVRLLQTI
ncbi:PDZ domain-containing protein [Stieleria sp. ICT_E10.1]|uniref:PDZ domain-containing protein n=1 Tax=Stieleria sedimenti TaxID=2976331 RepID=UPI00217F58B1|nr:PDZ domain-containing protein [Stieleria sedimenti]MCS7467949.1 PDZ domain-containing protein [Stieleria sedimenti]